MNLQNATFHLPFLLAQADTPAEGTPVPAATPDTTSYMTVNGQPATPEQIAAAKKAGTIGGIVGLLILLLAIAALWKIFTKAGKPGWFSIIPILNAITMIQIAGRPAWWFILLIVPVVNIVILFLLMIDLAKSFGYGVGFGLGLVFLSPIFLLILAFGGSRYVGPGGNAAGAYPGGYPPAGYPPATM